MVETGSTVEVSMECIRPEADVQHRFTTAVTTQGASSAAAAAGAGSVCGPSCSNNQEGAWAKGQTSGGRKKRGLAAAAAAAAAAKLSNFQFSHFPMPISLFQRLHIAFLSQYRRQCLPDSVPPCAPCTSSGAAIVLPGMVQTIPPWVVQVLGRASKRN